MECIKSESHSAIIKVSSDFYVDREQLKRPLKKSFLLVLSHEKLFITFHGSYDIIVP